MVKKLMKKIAKALFAVIGVAACIAATVREFVWVLFHPRWLFISLIIAGLAAAFGYFVLDRSQRESRLRAGVKRAMEAKSTKELLGIVVVKDRDVWTEYALQTAEETLKKRDFTSKLRAASEYKAEHNIKN